MHCIYFLKSFLFQLVFRSTGIKSCPFFILCPAITGRWLPMVGDPGCCEVGIPDTLDLVYASVHTPDINPQHLQTQSLSVFRSEKGFLKTVTSFPFKGASLFFPLCFVFHSQSVSFRLIRPYHSCVCTFPLQTASHPYSVVLYTASRTDGSHSRLLNYAQISLVSESEWE